MRSYRFHPAAGDEYDYEVDTSDAGDALISCVESALAMICELPGMSPAWPGRTDVRVRVLDRFPLSIIYRPSDREILIVAVAAHRREPGYWFARVTDDH